MALTGADGLMAEPESTRSVAEMLAGLTLPEKVTVTLVGRDVDDVGRSAGVHRAADRDERGGDDAEGAADRVAAGAADTRRHRRRAGHSRAGRSPCRGS